MSTPNYRRFGLSTTHSAEFIDGLKRRFARYPSHRIKTGGFIGLDKLQDMVDSLRKHPEGFDGLQFCFGLGEPLPGEAYGRYELIFTEVKLDGPVEFVKTVKTGTLYVSIPDNSPEPPGLGCPPLVCTPPPKGRGN